MDKKLLRCAFEDRFGFEKTRNFLLSYHQKGQLLFWQEEMLETFCQENKIEPLSIDECRELFGYCYVHGEELQKGMAPILYGYHKRKTEEEILHIQENYPFANCWVYGSCCVEKETAQEVNFCPACRNACVKENGEIPSSFSYPATSEAGQSKPSNYLRTVASGLLVSCFLVSFLSFLAESMWPTQIESRPLMQVLLVFAYLPIGVCVYFFASIVLALFPMKFKPLQSRVSIFAFGAICGLGQLGSIVRRLAFSEGTPEFPEIIFVIAVLLIALVARYLFSRIEAFLYAPNPPAA